MAELRKHVALGRSVALNCCSLAPFKWNISRQIEATEGEPQQSTMAYTHSKSVRFQDDVENPKSGTSKRKDEIKETYGMNGMQRTKYGYKVCPEKTCKTFKQKVLSRVFSEDYESDNMEKKFLDPRGPIIRRWNKIFLVACLTSLFIDPLFFYLPATQEIECIHIDVPLDVALTIIRSLADVFYVIQIVVQFQTAYVAPSSRVFGRGELVIDSSKITSRYLSGSFWLDFVAALPLPQVLGASWYLLSIERLEACWREVCRLESSACRYQYFDCQRIDNSRNVWFQSSNLTDFCDPNNKFYQFGIYADAMNYGIMSSPFLQKYFYCFWWGLKNLSSLGQNLSTSTYVGEISFAIIIAVLGLVLFGLLIGNMQSYLQSTMTRIEEWRIKRTDTEQWMRHRQLSPDLRQCVRRYDQYRWVATRGVDEEALLKGLPVDLRCDIKRHLCLDLVRRVPLFDEMDERMLDAICERLRPALYTEGMSLVRELDPVSEMIFIIRGHLDSTTTNGGRTGFFNTCRIGPGDFCGEELLTWALHPRPSSRLPSSTRTVRAVSEVEAFALVASDLKFVATQFRRLHSKQVRHTFRFYSLQWRAWAARFIQAAWRRLKRRRESIDIKAAEECMQSQRVPAPGKGAAVFVSRLVASTRRGGHDGGVGNAGMARGLTKPTEPDFSMEEEES